jgi:hypothetical protein
VITALLKSLTPCMLSSLTTLTGFAALIFSPSRIISGLGIYTSLGILISIPVTYILAAGYLSLRKHKQGTRSMAVMLPERMLSFPLRYRYPIALILLVLFAGSVLLASRLSPDTHTIRMLGTGNRVYQDNRIIEEKYGYTLPVEWIFETDRSDLEKMPGILDKMMRFQKAMKRLDPDYRSFSAADILREAPLYFDAKASPMPDFQSREKTLFYFKILREFPVMKDFYHKKSGSLRMIILIPMGSSQEISSRLEELSRLSGSVFNETHDHTYFTGYTAVYARIIRYVTRSMSFSILTAVLLILAVMFLLYPKPQLFIFVLIVNTLPIFAGLGIIRLLNLDLDITALTVIAIAAGLVVDDTIHFLYHFQENSKLTSSPLRLTIRQVTLPMISTSLLLISGFFPLIFSSLSPLKVFGLLMSVIILTANLCDIWLMPALIRIFQRNQESG